jgi:hypothetical protein
MMFCCRKDTALLLLYTKSCFAVFIAAWCSNPALCREFVTGYVVRRKITQLSSSIGERENLIFRFYIAHS